MLAQPGTASSRLLSITAGKTFGQTVKTFQGFESVSENIENNVKKIMYIARQINGEGFNNMKEDVEESLSEKAVEATN